MSEERKRGIFEYKQRPDLGVLRGSDQSYFVPTEFVVVKTAEIIDTGFKIAEKVNGFAHQAAENTRNRIKGGVNLNGKSKGDIYHSPASSD